MCWGDIILNYPYFLEAFISVVVMWFSNEINVGYLFLTGQNPNSNADSFSSLIPCDLQYFFLKETKKPMNFL